MKKKKPPRNHKKWYNLFQRELVLFLRNRGAGIERETDICRAGIGSRLTVFSGVK
jgi:hypothetical protein